MTGTSVLVSGATGYVGVHLCRRLAAEGHRVHALLRLDSDAARLSAAVPGVVLHRSAGDADAVRAAVAAAQPETVFHLASLAKIVHAPHEVDAMIEANIALGVRLLEALAASGRGAFINTGSYSEFVADGSVEPDSLYGATKAAFRTILDHYGRAGGLRTLTLVLFDVYGPDDWRNKLLSQLAAAAGAALPVPATAGRQELDLIHVDDVAAAFCRAASLLASDAAAQPLYAVQTGRRLALRDVARLLEQAVGEPIPVDWGRLPYRPGQRFTLWRGPTLPGWTPSIGLEEGLRRCYGAAST